MINKKDILLSIGIFLLAASLRFPFLAHPNVSVFDEHFQHITISNAHHGLPFFDVHPPLFPLLFESAVHKKNFALIQFGGNKLGVPFGDFPYYNLRFFVALVGSLLPVLIFWLSKLLCKNTNLALIPALLVIFDNSLIIYSRAILPDTLLLFLELLGLLLWLFSQQTKNRILMYSLLISSMVAFGAAASIKWTGLGFLATALLYEAYHKNIKHILISLTFAAAVYILIFAVFFVRLAGNHIESDYTTSSLAAVNFSQEKTIKNFSKFFIAYHRAMIQTNASYDAQFKEHRHPLASKPYEWLFNQKTIAFWASPQKNFGIVLAGNLPAWILGVLAMLILATLAALQTLGYPTYTVLPTSLYLLLGGFFINYFPLFFVGRSLFIYHYFPSLLFTYLLVPFALSFWSTMFSSIITMNCLVKILLAVIIIWFILFLPRTYGIPYPFDYIQNSTKFDTMAKINAVVV